MSDDSDRTRTYGMPDDDNRQPAPAQGMRGEQADEGVRSDETNPDLTHSERIDGREIAVEESSGVAFAEASGAVAANQARLAKEDAENEREEQPQERPAG